MSSDKQGKSGRCLDAQKAAVADRLNGGRWQIVGEFAEVESGKRASRPQLDAAIAACDALGLIGQLPDQMVPDQKPKPPVPPLPNALKIPGTEPVPLSWPAE